VSLRLGGCLLRLQAIRVYQSQVVAAILLDLCASLFYNFIWYPTDEGLSSFSQLWNPLYSRAVCGRGAKGSSMLSFGTRTQTTYGSTNFIAALFMQSFCYLCISYIWTQAGLFDASISIAGCNSTIQVSTTYLVWNLRSPNRNQRFED
jgi:hypothetical protein